ncbi:MAG: glycosyltransferase [Desulfovibrionaceae bacterium]
MPFDYRTLDPALRDKLLTGCAGKLHLASMARDALALAGACAARGEQPRAAFYAVLGGDLLLAAWEEEPLSGVLAQPLRTVLAGNPHLPGAFFDALAWLEGHFTPDPAVQRLLDAGRVPAALEALRAGLARTPDNAFHVQKLLELCPVEGDPDEARAALAAFPAGPAEPFRRIAQADLELACGRPDAAEPHYLAALETCPLPGVHARLGLCRHRQGRPREARTLWTAVLQRRPWHVNLLLRLHDELSGAANAAAPLPGGLEILLYTHNKADDLARALDALEAAGLDGCRVTVLDNDSGDGTAELLRRTADRLGAERLRTITAPVNVGAPAARNWLVRALRNDAPRPFAAFLDDDALVPGDWRERFGAAVAAAPAAAVWGCKVVDAARPWIVQNPDLHLRPEYTADTAAARLSVNSLTTDLHHQGLDFGQFDYLRPCVSVTGCCHLFRTETLLAGGGFDIAFSPTQFDDLDHDLRLGRAGGWACYQGHLTVRHLKNTGQAARRGGVAAGNALGNHLKLQARHAPADMAALRRVDLERCLADLSAKAARVNRLTGHDEAPESDVSN